MRNWPAFLKLTYRHCRLNDSSGFTYLSLLFIIAVIGITLAINGQVWSTMAGREKEAELLFRGSEIRNAIKAYYEASSDKKRYPKSLEELISDPMSPVTKRYLRRIYIDPMTNKPDWSLIQAPDGGIMGVKSISAAVPYKKKNFPDELKGLEDKAGYNEWEFIFIPQKQQVQQVLPVQQGTITK